MFDAVLTGCVVVSCSVGFARRVTVATVVVVRGISKFAVFAVSAYLPAFTFRCFGCFLPFRLQKTSLLPAY